MTVKSAIIHEVILMREAVTLYKDELAIKRHLMHCINYKIRTFAIFTFHRCIQINTDILIIFLSVLRIYKDLSHCLYY